MPSSQFSLHEISRNIVTVRTESPCAPVNDSRRSSNTNPLILNIRAGDREKRRTSGCTAEIFPALQTSPYPPLSSTPPVTGSHALDLFYQRSPSSSMPDGSFPRKMLLQAGATFPPLLTPPILPSTHPKLRTQSNNGNSFRYRQHVPQGTVGSALNGTPPLKFPSPTTVSAPAGSDPQPPSQPPVGRSPSQMRGRVQAQGSKRTFALDDDVMLVSVSMNFSFFAHQKRFPPLRIHRSLPRRAIVFLIHLHIHI